MVKYWLLLGCAICLLSGCKNQGKTAEPKEELPPKISEIAPESPDDSAESNVAAEEKQNTPQEESSSSPPKPSESKQEVRTETETQKVEAAQEPAADPPPETTDETKSEGEASEEKKDVPDTLDKVKEPKSDLEKTIVGPDGPAEPKENSRFGPSFPPKDSPNKKVPEDVKGMVMDPRIAPDSNADFDEKRVPLGRSSDQGKTGLSSIPRALVYYPHGDDIQGLSNSQGVRISASGKTSITKVRIDEPKGPFQFRKAISLPLVLAEGAGTIIEVQCDEGAEPHETTLTLESESGTMTIPLRYFPTPP